uniref:Uncharacterized protein n=1 Tax=Macrostomum lignano TaxID=282301 RepID=A0A1I8FNT4_9PLAT
MESAHTVVKKFSVDYDRTLIYNKIHHELNQLLLRTEKTQLMIANERRQRVEEKAGRDRAQEGRHQTLKRPPRSRAFEWEDEESRRKESEKKISEIEDQAALARSQSPLATRSCTGPSRPLTAEFYRLQKEAEGNKAAADARAILQLRIEAAAAVCSMYLLSTWQLESESAEVRPRADLPRSQAINQQSACHLILTQKSAVSLAQLIEMLTSSGE